MFISLSLALHKCTGTSMVDMFTGCKWTKENQASPMQYQLHGKYRYRMAPSLLSHCNRSSH